MIIVKVKINTFGIGTLISTIERERREVFLS